MTSAIHQAALADSNRETAITNVLTDRPARGIVTRFMREVGPMDQAAPNFPLARTAVAPLRSKAEAEGSANFSPLWSGQAARLPGPMRADAEACRRGEGGAAGFGLPWLDHCLLGGKLNALQLRLSEGGNNDML